MLLSIVVPWYKSRGTVLELYRRVQSACAQIPDLGGLEFVFIEDCGGDGEWEVIEQLAHDDSRVKAVQFSRNFGQHNAITAGLDLCTGDWTVVMDCDLQDRPEEIPKLYAKAMEGYDMVFARRGKRKDPCWKRITSRMFYVVFNWLSGASLDGEVANFSIISRKTVDAYKLMRESRRFYAMHMKWLGFQPGYVDVEHGARECGKSSYTLKKLIHLASESMIYFSNKPLRMSVELGFCLSFFSFLVALWVVFKKLAWGIPVDGWASLMISLWFLGGLVIANLGMIGIYVGKAFDESKRRPIYVISKRINV